MVQKTIVQLIDDIDGHDADESITFALDGVEYGIDLSAKNAKLLRNALAPFVDHGQRIGGRKQRGAGSANPPKAIQTAPARVGVDRAQNQAIREWARNRGIKVADRGRIPAELVAKFQAAHAS